MWVWPDIEDRPGLLFQIFERKFIAMEKIEVETIEVGIWHCLSKRKRSKRSSTRESQFPRTPRANLVRNG
jgi:hypothetical protein